LNSIWTVGHSNHPLEKFLSILTAHNIDIVTDIRRFPASRKWPHFNRSALAESLPAHGIGYAGLSELGGRRSPRPGSPHTAWRVAAFRGYADFMQTDEFDAALRELIRLLEEKTTVFCCTEAVFWRCHRQLVSDALLVHGYRIGHIFNASKVEAHKLTKFLKADGMRLTYPCLL